MPLHDAVLTARPRPPADDLPPILEGLNPGEAEASPFLLGADSGMPPSIGELGTLRRFGRGEFIYQQGQTSTHFFILVSGRVRIFLSLYDGTERVLCFAESGASFGESACFDGLPHFVTGMAVTPCQCRVVSRDAVLGAIAEDPTVALDLAQALSRKSRVLAMHLASDRMRAGDRVVLLLDQLVRAYGVRKSADSIGLTIRQPIEELARVIGLNRVTMSRELSRLAALGVVQKDGWDIVVTDVRALRRRAGQILG
jgi:CRP/FNR family cyclic AMP-dependent transcriptional regulator